MCVCVCARVCVCVCVCVCARMCLCLCVSWKVVWFASKWRPGFGLLLKGSFFSRDAHTGLSPVSYPHPLPCFFSITTLLSHSLFPALVLFTALLSASSESRGLSNPLAYRRSTLEERSRMPGSCRPATTLALRTWWYCPWLPIKGLHTDWSPGRSR